MVVVRIAIVLICFWFSAFTFYLFDYDITKPHWWHFPFVTTHIVGLVTVLYWQISNHENKKNPIYPLYKTRNEK